MYMPLRQTGDYSSVDLVVRTTLPPAGLASAVRAALQPMDPNLPKNDFRALQQLVDKAVSPRRFVVLLLAGFSGFALILASLGIYGVISCSVNQRTQEIGIRMALGARRPGILLMVMRKGMLLTVIGTVIGLAGAFALTRWMSSMLFGVTASDPATYVMVVLVSLGAAVLACAVPARRATRVDPLVALRYE